MKKIITLMLCVAILLTTIPCILYAESEISVYLDGEKIMFDVPPVIMDGRTLVPMRAIFEALGADVEWDGKEQCITATVEDLSFVLYIGKYTSYGSKMISFDVPPMIYNGRTMIPLRAVSEALCCDVEWNAEARSVYITSSEENDFYKYRISNKDDFIKYVKEYGTKNKDSYFVVSQSDYGDEFVFMYYFPTENSIKLGYSMQGEQENANIILTLDGDYKKYPYIANITAKRDNTVVTWDYDGYINANAFNKYYSPVISSCYAKVNGEKSSVSAEVRESLQDITLESLGWAIMEAADIHNLAVGKFGFTAILKDEPVEDVYKAEEKTYNEPEYNEENAYAEELMQELEDLQAAYEELEEWYNEEMDALLDYVINGDPYSTDWAKEIYKSYDLSGNYSSNASNGGNLDSYAAANALRQTQALKAKAEEAIREYNQIYISNWEQAIIDAYNEELEMLNARRDKLMAKGEKLGLI